MLKLISRFVIFGLGSYMLVVGAETCAHIARLVLLKTVCCNADERDLMLPGDDHDCVPQHQWMLSDGWYGTAVILDEHLASVTCKLMLKAGDAHLCYAVF